MLSAPVSGVILAGGASRRMGRDKALLDLGGRPLIAVVAERLRAVVGEVIICADQVERYAPFADRCVPDVYPGVGTLGGLHAGLAAAAHEWAIVVGCDMPFIRPALLAWFVAAAANSDLAILRHPDGRVEPLHAVYHRRCLSAIEAAIVAGERRADAFHAGLRVRYVSPEELAPLDPNLWSFRNLNTPEEWRTAQGDLGAV